LVNHFEGVSRTRRALLPNFSGLLSMNRSLNEAIDAQNRPLRRLMIIMIGLIKGHL